MSDKKGSTVDLADMLISSAAFHTYHEFADRVARLLVQLGIDPKSIPDEQARLEGDGSLTVFVVVPNFGEVAMSIPAGQWAWRQRQ